MVLINYSNTYCAIQTCALQYILLDHRTAFISERGNRIAGCSSFLEVSVIEIDLLFFVISFELPRSSSTSIISITIVDNCKKGYYSNRVYYWEIIDY